MYIVLVTVKHQLSIPGVFELCTGYKLIGPREQTFEVNILNNGNSNAMDEKSSLRVRSATKKRQGENILSYPVSPKEGQRIWHKNSLNIFSSQI